jgi:hypothetical protein
MSSKSDRAGLHSSRRSLGTLGGDRALSAPRNTDKLHCKQQSQVHRESCIRICTATPEPSFTVRLALVPLVLCLVLQRIGRSRHFYVLCRQTILTPQPARLVWDEQVNATKRRSSRVRESLLPVIVAEGTGDVAGA